MIPLSVAIRKGAEILPHTCDRYIDYPALASDSLGAALVGGLSRNRLAGLWAVASASRETFCEYAVHELNRLFPHLGASVRQWAKFAQWLETEGAIARLRPPTTYGRGTYRREVHCSLWQALVTMQDKLSLDKFQIATYLEAHSL